MQVSIAEKPGLFNRHPGTVITNGKYKREHQTDLTGSGSDFKMKTYGSKQSIWKLLLEIDSEHERA